MSDDAYQDYIDSLNSASVVTLVISVLHFLFSLIAVGGNITVLTAIWRAPSLQTPSNILLSGLALADLGVGLVVQPAFTAIHVLITRKYVRSLLTFFNVASSFLSGISVASVTALSIDRYLSLHFNLRYKEIVTKTRVKITLILIWINTGILTCVWLKSFRVYLFTACAFLSICTILICFANVKIYSLVRHHKAKIQDQLQSQQNIADHIRTAFQTLVLVAVFSLCSAPYLCLMITIQLIEPNRALWLALDCSVSLLLINSSLNPFLYCWRNKGMRKAVKRVLRLFWRCFKTEDLEVH